MAKKNSSASFLIFALLFILGLLLGLKIPLSYLFYLGFFWIVLLSLYLFWKRGRTFTVLMFFVLAGLLRILVYLYFPMPDRADQMTHLHEQIRVRIELRVVYSRLSIAYIHSIFKNNRWVDTHGKVQLLFPEGVDPGQVGDEMEVRGQVVGLPFFGVPFRKTISKLRQQGIILQIKVKDSLPPIRHSDSWTQKMRKYCQAVLQKGRSKNDPLIDAVILGDREKISYRDTLPFLYSNTIHIISISGLHVGILVIVLLFIFNALRVPYRTALVIVLILIWIYAGLTGFRVPIVRAGLMASIYLFGRFIERHSQLYNALGIAALIILMINPLSITNSGFQLSFICVFSLLWMTPILTSIFKSQFLSGSIAIWLGILPVVMLHYSIYSPITVLANLIALPFVTVMVWLSFASLLLSPFIVLIEPLNVVSEWVGLLLKWFITMLVSIPNSFAFVEKPSPVWISLYYMGVILLPPLRQYRKVQILIIACLCFLMPLFNLSLFKNKNELSFMKLGGFRWILDQNEQSWDLYVDSDPQAKLINRSEISRITWLFKISQIDTLFYTKKASVIQNELSANFLRIKRFEVIDAFSGNIENILFLNNKTSESPLPHDIKYIVSWKERSNRAPFIYKKRRVHVVRERGVLKLDLTGESVPNR